MATDRGGLPGERPQQPGQGEGPATWEADDVRRLRSYLRESQAALAARLGTRQQTVSEWETGVSRPR
ncbi:MAG: helix-turn-helix domain-containing protein, partial [Dehalococcoidia bacterium]